MITSAKKKKLLNQNSLDFMEPQFFVHEIPSTAQLKRKFSTEKKVVLIDRKRALWNEGMRNMKGRKKRDAGLKIQSEDFKAEFRVFARKIRWTTDLLRK